MSESTPNLGKLEPFTYVKDQEDFIYYVKGTVQCEEDIGYSAVCVYYPNESGDRAQIGNDVRYGKFASQGLEYERSAVLEHMPSDAARYVLERSRRGDIFNRQFLFLPVDDIAEIYNPQSSLRELLFQGSEALSNESLEAVHAAVAAFASVDVPLDSLGLYGSLQCGVVKDSLESDQLKDVDMLVRGIGYYDNVRTLTAESPAPDVPLPLTVAIDPYRSTSVRKRREIAQFSVPGARGVHCDVRLLRGFDDPNHYHDNITQEPEAATFEGEVIDASQSLSLPFAYQLEGSRDSIWVSGMHYRSLGVATVGDCVQVQGIRIKSDAVLISHPSDDWIRLHNRPG